MKRVVILAVALATTLVGVTSCDKMKNAAEAVSTAAEGGAEIDYQFLSKPEEVKKWYDDILAKAGDNAKVMNEVKMLLYRPSVEGTIKREGEKDYLFAEVVYQDPADKRKVEVIKYHGNLTGWKEPEKMEIQVHGPGAEDFRLENELFDFNQIKPELISKVISDALAKYRDDAKYEYQYVKNLIINIEGIKVDIHGEIKANGVEKTEYYKTDLQGNAR